jgi:hypothetical protein
MGDRMMFKPGDKVRHVLMGWTGTVVSYNPISGTHTVNGPNGPIHVPTDWLDLDDTRDRGGAMSVFLFCLVVAFVIGFAILRGASS